MPARTWTVESVADELLACEAERRDRPPFTDEWEGLDVATAYRVQDLTLQRRVDATLEAQARRAQALVQQHRSRIEALAQLLLARRSLDSADLNSFFAETQP